MPASLRGSGSGRFGGFPPKTAPPHGLEVGLPTPGPTILQSLQGVSCGVRFFGSAPYVVARRRGWTGAAREGAQRLNRGRKLTGLVQPDRCAPSDGQLPEANTGGKRLPSSRARPPRSTARRREQQIADAESLNSSLVPNRSDHPSDRSTPRSPSPRERAGAVVPLQGPA